MRKGPDGLNGLLPFGSEWASVGDDDDVSEVLLAANDPTQCRGVVHPLMNAGDVLFFSGGATAHGSVPYPVDAPHSRQTALFQYISRDVNLGGPQAVAEAATAALAAKAARL